MMNVRLLSACLVCWLFTSQMTFGQNAGLVAVIGEVPERVEFQIPVQSPYKFQYDPARITLWDSIDMQNAIPSGTAFLASAALPGCEVDLSDFAALQTCFSGNGGGVALGCNGFDTDADNDVALDDYAAFQGTIIGPACNVVIVPVFVQGLTASTGLGDVTITLLIDPEADDNFTVEATQPVTVVSVVISPTSGPAGAPITITLQPAIPPIAFDPSSTAAWSGAFDPIIGSPSSMFDILFDATQVHESSPASAIFVAGDGTMVNTPDFTAFDFPGLLDGLLTLNLGLPITRRVIFMPTAVPLVWESITYLDSSISTGPPVLNGEPNTLEIMILSNNPNPIPDEVILLQSYWAHLAVVMRIAENPTTIANAPAFVDVDLVALDSGGAEIDRKLNIRLDRVTGDDGDPANLVYHSDLTKPIILVDVALNQVDFPNVVLLHSQINGRSVIVPK